MGQIVEAVTAAIKSSSGMGLDLGHCWPIYLPDRKAMAHTRNLTDINPALTDWHITYAWVKDRHRQMVRGIYA